MVEGPRVRAHLSLGRRLPGAALLLFLAVLPAVLWAEPALPGPGSCEGCNVVIVSIDTLRPDRLETFGYDRPTSPNLDAIARRGIVFERAYSNSLATAEAHMSLFTSLHPSVHGIRSLDSATASPTRLASGIPTLAALLRDRGYATGGFHDGGNVSSDFGFDRGFDVYRHGGFMNGAGWKATRDWLAAERGRPFFLFLHSYHVHDPYTPEHYARGRFATGYEGAIVSERRELRRLAKEACADDPECSRWRLSHYLYWKHVDKDRPEDVAHLSDLYDAEILEVDAAMPRLLEAIEAMPGDTLVFFLSDHGEAFAEHGKMMHATLHEEVLRVPLIALHPRAPELAGRRFARPVSLVNVAPMVLEWLGIEAPDSFQGKPPARADSVLGELPAWSQLALVRDHWKLLLRGGTHDLPAEKARLRDALAKQAGVDDAARFTRIELFDLTTDPGEQRDLGAAHPRFEPMLREALERVAANAAHAARQLSAPAAPAEMSPALLRQLEALGYVD